MKRTRITLSAIALGVALLSPLFCSCGQEKYDEEVTDSTEKPLAPGEVCHITFANSVDDFSQVTTRSIPEGQKSVLQDFTNHELKSEDGGRAGWLSSEIRTKYDEEAQQAATRSFKESQFFGANSKFRMLVFAGNYGGTVDMTSPVANMVCRVNSTGNGASFIAPTTELGLLKGRYTFICFPADEKYNRWQVGQSTGFEIPVGIDEDFLCMQIANVDLNNSSYSVDLSKFKRFGYQLTVKFSVNEELGYLLSPQDKLELEISDAGSGTAGRVINNAATFNLKTNAIKDYTGNTSTFKDTLTVNGTGKAQTFTAVSNLVIANNGASQKLTIKYPRITVLKPAGTDGSKEDSVFTIKSGTYTTSEAVTFEAGKSYTITLAIGEQAKGIVVTFRNSAGDEKNIIFATSQLWYNKSTGKWGLGKEQCDYGYVENGINPGTSDMKLVNGTISYYFLYGKPEGCIGTATSGYYTGSSDLFDVNRDPCQKLGKGWISPTRDIFRYMSYQNTIYYNGSSTTKASSEYFPVDQNNNRIVNSGNPQWGSYTPTDGRANKSAIPGTWVNVSSPQAGNTQHNGSRLFLPAAGYRDTGGTTMGSVGNNGYYWGSQQYNSSGGHYFYFNSGRCLLYGNDRRYGFAVRCCLPE